MEGQESTLIAVSAQYLHEFGLIPSLFITQGAYPLPCAAQNLFTHNSNFHLLTNLVSVR